jgi:hypothetical protein
MTNMSSGHLPSQIAVFGTHDDDWDNDDDGDCDDDFGDWGDFPDFD